MIGRKSINTKFDWLTESIGRMTLSYSVTPATALGWLGSASHLTFPKQFEMGKKHQKTTAAADAVAAAQVAEAAAPARKTVAAAAPPQNVNALANMFAQSSVLFAKKASYVQGAHAFVCLLMMNKQC